MTNTQIPTNSLPLPTPSLSQLAAVAWQAATSLRSQAPAKLDAAGGECFLLLICPITPTLEGLTHVHSVAQVLRSEGGILSAIERSTGGLWVAGARWALASQCNVFLNLDLLTIDPNAQDWGDFKIKPEQVEVQRNELTIKALFDESPALLVQVRKHELADVMQALREAGLAQSAFTVGKPWPTPTGEAAKMEVYRDAKKQLGITVAELSQ